MAKVTSKLQVTVPKALADRFGIAPGDEIAWEPAGDAIRVVPGPKRDRRDAAARARVFDQATKRQQERQAIVGLTMPLAGRRALWRAKRRFLARQRAVQSCNMEGQGCRQAQRLRKKKRDP